MKKIIFQIIVLCATAVFLSGCIEDTSPTEYASATQVGRSPQALQALSNSTAAFMFANAYFGTVTAQEIGYPGMMILRDALTDAAYVTTSYHHFRTPWSSLSDFTTSRVAQPWRYYYRMILNANNTIFAVENPDDALPSIQHFVGNALVYRAMSYLDLMRMYEYKRTGVAALDSEADRLGSWGLTVPIVDEHTDPRNADNNPRVMFYAMYRFIMNDLNRAERYLYGFNRQSKVRANQTVVRAYKARLWLEIATRFQRYPADLALQIANEDNPQLDMYAPLGITTAREAYERAAHYARLVINQHTPLTYEQWHSTTHGFNDMSVPSWVFALSVNSIDAVGSRVDNFLSHAVTEYSRGYSRSQYHNYRMIDRRLWETILDDDWRKFTWKDPADVLIINGVPSRPPGSMASPTEVPPIPPQYHTPFRGVRNAPTDESQPIKNGDWEWHHRDAFVGFKFRTNGGDISANWQNAAQVDLPVIRVEEMYFIEAEALAYTDGLAAGVQALTSFLNTFRFRNPTFNIDPMSVDDFIDNHLITHKRIEFWGEGLAFFDIKRRRIAITRGYHGTNWLELERYNSIPGYVASWLNFFVPNEGESTLNRAIILNPNPRVHDSYGLWRP